MDSLGSSDVRTTTTPTAVTAMAGLLLALFGVYWDDAWHTDKGRDNLLSAPHLVLYIGVASAVGVVLLWGWRGRHVGRRESITGPVGIAVVGALVTLGSAPVDEWWHSTFGRDAVLWSPPHLLAVVGTLSLGTGVLLVMASTIDGLSTRFALPLMAVAGAAVVGGWQVLVLEYDTDVAQFSAFWYLPVLACALTAAALTVQAAARDGLRRWAASRSGAAYTLGMAIVAVVLWTMGFSTPIVPIVLPALLVADMTRARHRNLVERAAVFYVVLVGFYVPYLNLVPGSVAPSLSQALAGVLVGLPAVMLVMALLDPGVRWKRPAALTLASVALTAGVLLSGVISRPAAAHDPGQGVEAVTIVLMVEVDGRAVDLRAVGVLTGFEPTLMVARRAGRVIEGSLVESGANWAGTVTVDEGGRWFLYVEGLRGATPVEAWIPVVIDSDRHASRRTALYVVPDASGASNSQMTVGALLIFMSVLILGRLGLTVRSASSDNLAWERPREA